MHIGMLTACYDPVVNGVTQMIAQYEKNLTEAGHRVTIFTLGEPAPGEDVSHVIRSPAMALGKTGYHLAARYSSEAQSKLREVDVIHCHHLLMGLEFGKRYSQRPVVFTNHTRYDLYLSSYGRLPEDLAGLMMRGAWRRLTGFADVIIAPSASIRDVMEKAGVSAPIEIIENGVAVDRFRRTVQSCSRAKLGLPEDAFVITYVGRLSREKSIQRLVDEFRTTAAVDDGVHLLLVGGGALRRALEQQVADCGLADRVHFAGQVDPEQVPEYLHISDVFASASVTEVHPLAVIEAIVAGVPVIAVDSAGMRDVVEHDKSGILVDGAAGSLARAMTLMATDRSYGSQLREGAKRSGAQHDIGVTIEKTVALYERVIRRHSDEEWGSTGAIGNGLERQQIHGKRRTSVQATGNGHGVDSREC